MLPGNHQMAWKGAMHMAIWRGRTFGPKAMMALGVALIAAFLPMAAASGSAPTSRSLLNAPFRGISAPGASFELVESVIDYAPGAKFSVAATQTQYYLSVLSGEMTVDVDGKAASVASGKSTAVPAGSKLALSNAGNSQSARLFVTTLLPAAAVDQVHQPNSPGVAVFAIGSRRISSAPPVFDLIQMATEYDPGFKTPNHRMNELHLILHMTGQTSYHYLDGAAEAYGPRTQAVMYEGRAGWMSNETDTVSNFVMTWLDTPGKPTTSAVTATTAPAPPSTGTGMAKGREAPWTIGGWLLIALACLLAGKRALRDR